MNASPGPLTGVCILLTRPEENSRQLQSLLEQRGAEVWILPTLTIQPPEDLAPLIDAVHHLGDYDWIAFSSRNAVRAVFEALDEKPLPRHLKVGAVGPSTAAALKDYGVQVTCVPEEATGSALADEMRGMGVRDARVLLPVGDRARPELRLGLEAAGARVYEAVAYRTATPPNGEHAALDALRKNRIDLVVVASPSALSGLVSMLGPDAVCLSRVRWVCIGPTTAAALTAAGFEPAAIASVRSAEGLADAVTSLYTGESKHDPA